MLRNKTLLKRIVGKILAKKNYIKLIESYLPRISVLNNYILKLRLWNSYLFQYFPSNQTELSQFTNTPYYSLKTKISIFILWEKKKSPEYFPKLSREVRKNCFTENVLSPSGPDDNLGPHRRNPNFDTWVAGALSSTPHSAPHRTLRQPQSTETQTKIKQKFSTKKL